MKTTWNTAKEQERLTAVLDGYVWGTIAPEFVKSVDSIAACAGAKYGLLTFSATAALESVLRGLNIGAEDEVIVASWSDPADAMVTAAVGAAPVFADVCMPDCVLTREAVAACKNSKSRAVIADLSAAGAAALPELAAYCKGEGLYLLVNAGDALGARVNGEPLTRYADAAFVNMGAGTQLDVGLAGAVITDKRELWDLFFAYHNCGRSYGEGCTLAPDEIIGGDLRVAEWQAAVLNVRLEQEKADTITEPKRVFMPDQPFFADPYFAKLTGKTV